MSLNSSLVSPEAWIWLLLRVNADVLVISVVPSQFVDGFSGDSPVHDVHHLREAVQVQEVREETAVRTGNP